ncbi:hypothetical protein BsWGS_03243 [Bradybaena similaris]
MTAAIFEDWLKSFDRKMQKKKRHIILFVDNATCHPKIELQNVKLQFLPPNTTALVQPLDQGVIQTFKLKFRQKQLLHLITVMESNKDASGTELMKQVNLLDVVYWIAAAWKEVDNSTILKCFCKAGFHCPAETHAYSLTHMESASKTDVPIVSTAISTALDNLSKELFGYQLTDISMIDSGLQTCNTIETNWDLPATAILAAEDVNSESDNEQDSTCTDIEKTYTIADAHNAVELLRTYSITNGRSDILDVIMDLREKLNLSFISSVKQQTTILDFFSSQK